MKTIRKSIIQPRLHYCSQLWSPDNQHSINSIEAVLHHFLARVSGLENMNHWERLKKMNLYSQERRRERYMAIFIWKISEGQVHGYDLTFTNCARKGRLAKDNYDVCTSTHQESKGSFSCSEGLQTLQPVACLHPQHEGHLCGPVQVGPGQLPLQCA